MPETFSWCVTAACLGAGGFGACRAGALCAAGRAASCRLRKLTGGERPGAARTLRIRRGLEWLGRHAAGDGAGVLRMRLARAGHGDPSAVFVFAALRLVAAVCVFGVALAPAWWSGRAIGPRDGFVALFLGLAAHRAFSVALEWRIAARMRAVRRELPYVLDLLVMVLDAGVSADQALQHVGAQIGPVAPIVAAGLARYGADTAEGVPYAVALDRLGQRLAVAEGRDFVLLLKQNLYQGGELGQPLRRLAHDLSESRLTMAREQTGRKAVLLTFVMLFFFMPVLMAILVGPAVSDIYQTLSHVERHVAQERMKR